MEEGTPVSRITVHASWLWPPLGERDAHLSVLMPGVSFRIEDVSRRILDASQSTCQLAVAIAVDEGLQPGMVQALRWFTELTTWMRRNRPDFFHPSCQFPRRE